MNDGCRWCIPGGRGGEPRYGRMRPAESQLVHVANPTLRLGGLGESSSTPWPTFKRRAHRRMPHLSWFLVALLSIGCAWGGNELATAYRAWQATEAVRLEYSAVINVVQSGRLVVRDVDNRLVCWRLTWGVGGDEGPGVYMGWLNGDGHVGVWYGLKGERVDPCP